MPQPNTALTPLDHTQDPEVSPRSVLLAAASVIAQTHGWPEDAVREGVALAADYYEAVASSSQPDSPRWTIAGGP